MEWGVEAPPPTNTHTIKMKSARISIQKTAFSLICTREKAVIFVCTQNILSVCFWSAPIKEQRTVGGEFGCRRPVLGARAVLNTASAANGSKKHTYNKMKSDRISIQKNRFLPSFHQGKSGYICLHSKYIQCVFLVGVKDASHLSSSRHEPQRSSADAHIRGKFEVPSYPLRGDRSCGTPTWSPRSLRRRPASQRS